MRKERVADAVRDCLASLFQGGRLSDPRLEGVTITGTKLSSDLELASVYYRVYDPQYIESAKRALIKAKGLFRSQLSKELGLRRVPDIRFFYDESVEVGSRIEKIITDFNDGEN